MAQRFGLTNLQLSGEAILLADGVRYVSDRRIADFSAASGSILLLPPNAVGRQIVWFNREGRQLGVAVADAGRPSSGSNWIPLLSPDGNHAALERSRGSASDIWVYDLKTGARNPPDFRRRFQYEPGLVAGRERGSVRVFAPAVTGLVHKARIRRRNGNCRRTPVKNKLPVFRLMAASSP